MVCFHQKRLISDIFFWVIFETMAFHLASWGSVSTCPCFFLKKKKTSPISFSAQTHSWVGLSTYHGGCINRQPRQALRSELEHFFFNIFEVFPLIAYFVSLIPRCIFFSKIIQPSYFFSYHNVKVLLPCLTQFPQSWGYPQCEETKGKIQDIEL